MSFRTELAKFLRISRRTLGRFGEFSARGSRGLCVYTHIESNFEILALEGLPTSSGAMTWVNLGYCKRRVRARKKGKRRQCLRDGDTTPTPKTYAKESKSRLLDYFFGRTESFIALPTRNLSVVFAGIWIVSPVAGLRPSRAFRSERTNFPKPGNTNSPLDFTSEVARFPRSSKSCFT